MYSFTMDVEPEELRTIMAHMDSILTSSIQNECHSATIQQSKRSIPTTTTTTIQPPYGYSYQLKQLELKTILQEFVELQSVG